MSNARSVLVSVVGRDFADLNLAETAHQLDAQLRALDELNPKLADVVAAELTADGPVVIQGTGDTHFDSVAAAAVGVPLLFVAEQEKGAAELAVRHAKDVQATVAGVVTPDHLQDGEALARHHGVRPEQVFVGNGSDEVLAHAFAALLKHSGPLLFPDITYSFYPVYCRLFGIGFETVPLEDT